MAKKPVTKKDPKKTAMKAAKTFGGSTGGAVSAISKRNAAMKKQMDEIEGKKKKK
jgi:hypothetical protein